MFNRSYHIDCRTVMHVPPRWARHYTGGYEVSSAGDRRFSALNARLRDGRQLDVKGYRRYGDDWRLGKGKRAITGAPHEALWLEYLGLWRQWAHENASLIDELYRLAEGRPLTDRFATTPVNQARALSIILSERTLCTEFTIAI